MDFLVDADPVKVRTVLSQYPGFEVQYNNLFYKLNGKLIKVETFNKDTFKMPDLNSVYSKTFQPQENPNRRLSVPRRFNEFLF